MSRPNRQAVTPLLIENPDSESEEIVLLQRLPFSEHRFKEGWLQDLIYRHPSLLSVDEIEPEYADLIPLGREVTTDVGRIDNLYISPDGLITLVEAKLWRNPQARREVVGQIIDYATQLSSWSYTEFDERVTRARGKSVWQIVNEFSPDDISLSENDFIDSVARNLRRGRFLLLIVGDGIKESVEDLSAFLQRTPSLQFKLRLLQLALYKTGENTTQLLVVPSAVVRTKEVTRAVIELSDETAKKVIVQTDLSVEPTMSQVRTYSRMSDPLNDREFFSDLLEATDQDTVDFTEVFLQKMHDLNLIIDNSVTAKMIRFQDPGGSGKNFKLLEIKKYGTFGISLIGKQTVEAGYSFEDSPAQKYVTEMSKLFDKELVPESKLSLDILDSWNMKTWPKLTSLKQNSDEYFEILESYLTAMYRQTEREATSF